MRNTLWILAYLIIPAIVTTPLILLSMPTYYLVVQYLLSIVWFWVFFRNYHRSIWLFPVGFAVTPVVVFLYEYYYPGWFQYMATFSFSVYYAIPTTIAAVFVSAKKAKRLSV